jgi:large subunit ribosomal protein L13
MKTYSPKPRDIERRWYVIDASGAVLGRLATEVAAILRGKHKPIFAPHMDTGDHVIVINAKGVRLTGGKETKKVAYRHSGYPGGLTETSYDRLMAQKPHFAVEKAIRGMLPKNRLGRAMGRKLQVYPGPEHPHRAQKPQPLKLGEVPSWEGLPKQEPTKAPEPTPSTEGSTPAPASKRTTAKRSSAASRAKATAKTTTKRAAKTTSTSKSASTAKRTVKSTAKRATASSTSTSKAKTTSASSSKAKTTSKSTANTASGSTTGGRTKRTLVPRRKKKEE